MPRDMLSTKGRNRARVGLVQVTGSKKVLLELLMRNDLLMIMIVMYIAIALNSYRLCFAAFPSTELMVVPYC